MRSLKQDFLTEYSTGLSASRKPAKTRLWRVARVAIDCWEWQRVLDRHVDASRLKVVRYYSRYCFIRSPPHRPSLRCWRVTWRMGRPWGWNIFQERPPWSRISTMVSSLHGAQHMRYREVRTNIVLSNAESPLKSKGKEVIQSTMNLFLRGSRLFSCN